MAQNAMAVPLILPISFLSGESDIIFGSNWVRLGMSATVSACKSDLHKPRKFVLLLF